VCGERQEIAFCTLKLKLMTKPILKYPDFTEEFILTTDASNYGAGAVLLQGEVGKYLLVAIASLSYNKAEKNYSTVKENWRRSCGG
jgi:hypothetical protein